MKNDPVAECRFFTAEDACRIALAAYYAAGAELEPPPGEPWMLDGSPYASASDFADCFCQQVADRVSAIAYSQHLSRSGSSLDGPWWPNQGEELTEYGANFLRRIMKHLPPGDNPGNNQLSKESVNG